MTTRSISDPIAEGIGGGIVVARDGDGPIIPSTPLTHRAALNADSRSLRQLPAVSGRAGAPVSRALRALPGNGLSASGVDGGRARAPRRRRGWRVARARPV